jgi:hypothetical protein
MNYFSQELGRLIANPYNITKIVGTFNMESCAPRDVPADPNERLIKPTNCQSLLSEVPYREAVGSLLYLAIMTTSPLR